jgi:hypothetical protein
LELFSALCREVYEITSYWKRGDFHILYGAPMTRVARVPIEAFATALMYASTWHMCRESDPQRAQAALANLYRFAHHNKFIVLDYGS